MEPPETVALLTPVRVRQLLDRHGLAPRKAAGQNFVVDPNTVRKIVRDADVDAGDVVLEVGPGLGSLTLALARAARRVVAVEIDAGLVHALEEVLADVDDVEVVHADALKVDLDDLLGGVPARLIANLPYNVATPLVFHALASDRVTDLFVMVQREVGERWAAGPGHPLYSGVSVKLALVSDVEVVAAVPPTVFHPAPNVDSVTVRITRKAAVPAPAVRAHVTRVVDTAFGQRRKTLRNALKQLVPTEALDRGLEAAGIEPRRRAEELGLDDFIRLAESLPDGGPIGD